MPRMPRRNNVFVEKSILVYTIFSHYTFRMNFPEQIKQIIKDKPYTQNNIGMTDSQVLIFDDMVLKIEKRLDMERKVQRLQNTGCCKCDELASKL